MPVLHRAPGPRGPRLPAGERVPPLTGEHVAPAPDAAADVALLETGAVDVIGRLVDASNTTLYCTVTGPERTIGAVYKPISGERPLWDFPTDTLSKREVAAYRFAAWTGLDVVPPTVLRDGPFGPGSLQRWVGPDPGDESEEPGEPGAGVVDVVAADAVPPGWLPVLRATGARGEDVVLCHADDWRLAQMAVFDALANNADRKGGHVIGDSAARGGRVFGVDHGLTFNADHKLRTVLWGWAGDPVPDELLEVAERVVAGLLDDTLEALLGELLDDDELVMLGRRAERLVASGRFPRPRGGGPAIPWPAF